MTRSVVVVGGGLANCLLGLRLRALRPDVSLTLVESSSCLGGQHTWSFHGTDVAPETGAWLLPLASYSWPHHSVRFPERRRRLTGSYHSLTSEHLHEVSPGFGRRIVGVRAPHVLDIARSRAQGYGV